MNILKFLILFISLFSYTLANDAYKEKTYTIIIPESWKPYYFVNKNGEIDGYSIDLIESILKEANIKYKYKVVKQTKQLYPPLRSGDAHILPNLGISSKRESFISYSHKTDTSKLLIYKRSNSTHIKNMSDVKLIGTVARNIANCVIKENYPDIKIKTYNDMYDALSDILTGDIDAFCYPEPLVKYFLKESNLEDKIEPFFDTKKETFRAIAIAKTNPELITPINKALETIKQNGDYEKIYQKWFAKEKEFALSLKQTILSVSIFFVVIFIIFIILNRKKLLVTNGQLQVEVELQKKKLEKQNILIVNQSKMVAIGDMIGNIAHQWRQPLSSISMHANNILADIDLDQLDSKETKDGMNSILEQTEHLSSTIETFRDLIKGSKESKDVILQETIEKSIHIVSATLKNNYINIEENLEDNPIVLNMVENELTQVLINIINNAKDALLINDSEDKKIIISLLKKGDYALITIEDNGGGISEDILPRIFEPYFTTKHPSQGTGLGLHISYKIITENLKGKLYAQNTKIGVKFFIELPLN